MNNQKLPPHTLYFILLFVCFITAGAFYSILHVPKQRRVHAGTNARIVKVELFNRSTKIFGFIKRKDRKRWSLFFIFER